MPVSDECSYDALAVMPLSLIWRGSHVPPYAVHGNFVFSPLPAKPSRDLSDLSPHGSAEVANQARLRQDPSGRISLGCNELNEIAFRR